MKKAIKFEGFTIFRNWDKEASERIKRKLREMKLSNKIMAELITMPLPTFNDKISGKTSWKLEEIAKICVLLGETSDCIIFGNPIFITEWYVQHSSELKANIKTFLVASQNYESLGKLTADGFFDK